MKVLITGANGFIGKNLISHLQENENIEILKYDIDTPFSLIEENIQDIEFIYHLAGVNRPKDNSEFFKGNTDLTKQILDLIKSKNLSIPFLITSSIQATRDNDYGKSKKMAEEVVLDYGKNNPVYVYRLHNVFGKWCRPNYNSVVATFCNNIARDLDINVNDENAELELIYIDDIVQEFINLLFTKKPSNVVDNVCYINPVYKITLGKLAETLRQFKNSMNSIFVPNTGDEFVKKLYSTYISYVPVEKMVVEAVKNVDERGSFTELVKTNTSGQVSISVSKPGIVRGNHYHHTKIERFIVVKGHAKIKFTHIVTKESYEFEVDDKKVQIVTIPVGYTHNIKNIGNDEMVLVIWCNELFDKERPDTCFKAVNDENVKKVI